MQNQKGVFPLQRDPAHGGTTLLVGIVVIVVAASIIFGGVFAYQYLVNKKSNTQLQVQSNQQNQNQQQQKVNQQTSITPEPEQNNNGQNNDKSSNQPVSEIIGGACSYYVINGSCEIFSIAKTSESIQQKSSTGYEGYDVEFVFTSESSSALPENINKILSAQKSPHPLQLTNSWYPGPLYLAKYNIKENNIFDCQALVIAKGTCSPVIFKFSKINLSDYFESH